MAKLTRAGKALDDHQDQTRGNPPWYGCTCGERFDTDVERRNHQAEAVVAAADDPRARP